MHSFWLGVTAILIPLLNASPLTARAAGSPSVSIKYGTVIGTSINGVDNFQGIPFAQPPVGNLRLRKPLAINSNLGTINATTTPRSCAQFQGNAASFPGAVIAYLANSPLFQSPTTTGEDCLTLTVTRPTGVASTAKLPVLFWIYGGAYATGSASSYDGTSLVQTSVKMGSPVIFVAVQYRLGGFGFLPGSQVKAAGVANLGLLDQRLGMQWVADNIAAFGGDSSKVTIWGESAGAGSVFHHLVVNEGDNTYNGKQLFRGAIMNSGSMDTDQPVDGQIAQDHYDKIVTAAGCQTAADSLQCLRSLDYTSFLNAAAVLPSTVSPYAGNLAWRPRPDGILLPTSGFTAIQSNKYAKVAMLSGNQQDEGTLNALFASNAPTPSSLVTFMRQYYYPIAAQTFLQRYIGTYSTDPAAGSPFFTGIFNQLYPGFKLNAAVLGDATQVFPRRYFHELAAANQPTWSFTANYSSSTPFLGTYHTTDIAYEFGQTTGVPMTTIQGYYLSFVNTLDPNELVFGKPGFISWPKWTDGSRQSQIVFGATQNVIVSDTYRDASYQVFKQAYTDTTN